MSPKTFHQIVLRERPVADILPNTFESKTKAFDELRVGKQQALVQITYLSLDPAMRGWLRDARSYLPPVKIGEVMRASGLGVVVSVGEGSKFKKGDLVLGSLGWTEFAVMNDGALTKISPPSGSTALDFLNTLGVPGLTAYFGLYDVGKLKAGETLVVSGAAGAVGSLVCQLGKRSGARVIGIAGAADKCAWLENDLGVEKCLNYKSPTFREDFRKTVGYLDVYFDNVGGEILDLALSRLKKNARVVLCGAISAYNSERPTGLMQYQSLIGQRAKIEGFIVLDYVKEYPRAIEEIATGLADGSIKRKFHIVDGLQNAPSALPMLFSGTNTGKLVVKVSDEPRVVAKL
ncbi:NAD(P)-binding protein [Rhizopogon vinicolor AM-OR11-026]|uniref:NAD(P)-binding protein n=1 Tax=Rhizopogon vinicolor AM-OR11-026 TaxID=1314800 RepID=A0A1B7NEF9_9AGAM|nr:NAD(P)-binding protein [Rhizopogon vinicolor AM-OR11-026]